MQKSQILALFNAFSLVVTASFSASIIFPNRTALRGRRVLWHFLIEEKQVHSAHLCIAQLRKSWLFVVCGLLKFLVSSLTFSVRREDLTFYDALCKRRWVSFYPQNTLVLPKTDINFETLIFNECLRLQNYTFWHVLPSQVFWTSALSFVTVELFSLWKKLLFYIQQRNTNFQNEVSHCTDLLQLQKIPTSPVLRCFQWENSRILLPDIVWNHAVWTSSWKTWPKGNNSLSLPCLSACRLGYLGVLFLFCLAESEAKAGKLFFGISSDVLLTSPWSFSSGCHDHISCTCAAEGANLCHQRERVSPPCICQMRCVGDSSSWTKVVGGLVCDLEIWHIQEQQESTETGDTMYKRETFQETDKKNTEHWKEYCFFQNHFAHLHMTGRMLSIREAEWDCLDEPSPEAQRHSLTF